MSYLGKETTFTWLGHATFLIETPSGRRVIVDPWLEGNPKCPEEFHDPGPIDLILLTHGHFDHIADVVPLGLKHGCPVVTNPEIAVWLRSKGLETIIEMNKGGTIEACALQITMTNAHHSSGITDGDQIIYGGEPAGYLVETENEFRFYIAGDTCVFGDMALIRELHNPFLAILPIGDHYTMGPREAAKAANLLGVQVVIPCHFGTFPVLHGTPEQMREALGRLQVQVVDLAPGETLE
ncbi:MAG: metal-dependent hydrolase [Planctomycetota bacterium]|jgi:L-ascorbate metabolism protein UlaG (beta-lactamase superfamily)